MIYLTDHHLRWGHNEVAIIYPDGFHLRRMWIHPLVDVDITMEDHHVLWVNQWSIYCHFQWLQYVEWPEGTIYGLIEDRQVMRWSGWTLDEQTRFFSWVKTWDCEWDLVNISEIGDRGGMHRNWFKYIGKHSLWQKNWESTQKGKYSYYIRVNNADHICRFQTK